MTYFTIDFEASCLPRDGRSYPIEVGISDGWGRCRSWLIRPHPAWLDWTWTQEAQALHGIDPGQLAREGRPAHEVLAELCAAVGGRRVIADSDLDAYWLDALAAAAGTKTPFVIDHLANIIDEIAPTQEQADRANRAIEALGQRRHRAGPDARRLALWLEVVASRDEHGAGHPAFRVAATAAG